MDIFEWERTTYREVWHLAYDAGKVAQQNGLLRQCNLSDNPFCHNGKILKVYRSAWEQGWDNSVVPSIFGQMEDKLKDLPLRPI